MALKAAPLTIPKLDLDAIRNRNGLLASNAGSFRVSGYDPARDTYGFSMPEKLTAPATRLIPKTREEFRQARKDMRSSKQELRGKSDQELIGKTDQSLMERTLMPNLRPKVDALNYLLENRSINKIRDEQLNRKNLYYQTPSLSVRPIQDLPPEVLAAQENALSRVRSTYSGSDPIMNSLQKNIATAQRGQMQNEQIAGRAQQVLQERGRWDDQMRMNQQLAAETAGKNLDREQDFADFKTGAKTEAMEAKKKLNSTFLSQIGMNIDTAAEYNQQKDALEDAVSRQNYEDQMNVAYMNPDEGARMVEMAKLQKDWAGRPARLIPKYGDVQRGAWRPRLPERFATRRIARKTS